MKKKSKSILALLLSLAMCFLMVIPSFAADAATETLEHQSQWLELNELEAPAINEVRPLLGNVNTGATPSVATVGDVTVMAYADLYKLYKTVNENDEIYTEGEDNSANETTTSLLPENRAMYSVYDNQKNVWKAPKQIAASSAEWFLANVQLAATDSKIYAICWELALKDMFDIGNSMDIMAIMSLTIPDSKIVIYEYDAVNDKFVPFKTFDEKSNALYNPAIVINGNAISVTWVSVPQIPLMQMLTSGFSTSCAYSELGTDNKWSKVKNVFSKEVKMQTDDDMDFTGASGSFLTTVSGAVNGELAIAHCDYAADGACTLKIFAKDGSVIYSEKVEITALYYDKFADADKASFYYIANGTLYRLDGTTKLTPTTLVTDLGAVNALAATNDGFIYVPAEDTNAIYERRYDAAAKKYDSTVYEIAKFENDLVWFDVAQRGEYNIIVVQEDTSLLSDVNDETAEFCGHSISYIQYDKVKNPVTEDSEKPSEKPTEKPTEKPSEKPTEKPTKPSDDKESDKKPAKPSDDKKPAKPDTNIPDTGSTAAGIIAFAVLGVAAAACIMLAKKKKSVKNSDTSNETAEANEADEVSEAGEVNEDNNIENANDDNNETI